MFCAVFSSAFKSIIIIMIILPFRPLSSLFNKFMKWYLFYDTPYLLDIIQSRFPAYIFLPQLIRFFSRDMKSVDTNFLCNTIKYVSHTIQFLLKYFDGELFNNNKKKMWHTIKNKFNFNTNKQPWGVYIAKPHKNSTLFPFPPNILLLF